MARTAVVVGGGIGGLTAAVSLSWHGWQVTVLERAPEFTEVGAGITLMSNALAGLDALDVGPEVRATGSISAPGGTRRYDGRWLSRVPAGGLEKRLGLEVVGIHRATLVDILRSRLPEASLLAGAEVVDVTPSAPALVSYRRDGRLQHLTADVVVAADGINSGIRRDLWRHPSSVRYSGVTAWRAVTPEPWPVEVPVGLTWSRGAEFGVVPLGDGRIYWFVALNAPPGRRYDDDLAELRRLFGGWHEPIPELMDATRPGTVLHNDIFELRPDLHTYVHGRVVLLGDAAHAMVPHLGQGACQAIEDAVVLGALLAGTGAGEGAGVDAALAEYDRLRRPRAQSVARSARLAARLGQRLENPAAVAVRNSLMRSTPPQVAMGALARVARWRP